MMDLELCGFTLTCLAVEKPFRGNNRGHNLQHKGINYKSLAEALVSSMCQRFFLAGLSICVVSTAEGPSTKLCTDLGFRAMGLPFVSPISNLTLFNLVLKKPYDKKAALGVISLD